MCGIAGFFSAKPLSDNASSHLDRMLASIHHRGPDGTGVFLEKKEGIALGHTRLSINDLEGGCQPLSDPQLRRILTVNGEFYDFKRQRARLMALGDRFETRSDSEIALGLHRIKGLDFVEDLRGEFAFTLFDRDKEELILVRDRFGIRPLFFHLTDDTLYYGSEVKSVLANPDVPRRISPEGALNQLMQTIVPGTSAFEGIEALNPGELMVVRKKGERLEVTRRFYWDMNFPSAEEHDAEADPQEHIERIREELIRAIVFRLEADVPVGCYLSGGIDSCCILGLASGAMQSPVKAFTISFDNDDYDEASIAREMAVSAKADHEMIHLDAGNLYGENFINTVWHAERTFYNTLGVAKNLMSRRVRECGYKTVITGEGADELFAGYPAFKRDMFLHGIADQPESLRREYQAALEKSNQLFRGAILAENQRSHPAWDALCGFTPSWVQPWMDTLDVARPLLSDDVAHELRDYDPLAAIADKINPSALEGRHPLDRAQYTWSKCQLEGQILNWGGDRVDMANSMESRPAFLDHHLAEAALKVPPSLRIRGNIEKWVLREAVRGVLPEVLYKREKFAFMAPPAHTDKVKQARLRELTDAFLNPKSVANVGLLDPKRVQTFLTDYEKDTDPVSLTRKDVLVNHLLSLHILHHQFIAGERPGLSRRT